MAPEMLRREVYDHRVDYFSLGCMVVEFVVGVCPFRTRDAAHWGGRKKKKKKKKDTEDRALRKQAKKEDARAKPRCRNQMSRRFSHTLNHNLHAIDATPARWHPPTH